MRNKPVAQRLIRPQFSKCIGQHMRIAWRTHDPIHAIINDLNHTTSTCRHDRPPRQHPLNNHATKRLRRNRRMRNNIDRTHARSHIILKPKKMHPPFKPIRCNKFT
jgi:hypothetical protein